jgi:predicted transcriptional regulator
MTRTYALKRLLEHGAMTRKEIRVVTGWRSSSVNTALGHCLRDGLVRRVRSDGCSGFVAVGCNE